MGEVGVREEEVEKGAWVGSKVDLLILGPCVDMLVSPEWNVSVNLLPHPHPTTSVSRVDTMELSFTPPSVTSSSSLSTVA